MTPRRELTSAVLGCAVAGGLALSAGGQPWAAVTVTRPAPLPPVDAVVAGSALAPLVPAAGLLLLAAAVALFAVRSWGRVVLGVLVAAAGAALVTEAARALAGAVAVDPADLGSQLGLDRAEVAVDPSVGWPVLALLAGVLGVLAGLLVALRGRAWPGMGQRYQRTGSGTGPVGRRAPRRPETDEDRHQAAWKALDGGTDPTVDDAER